jgi:hypothetical protein
MLRLAPAASPACRLFKRFLDPPHWTALAQGIPAGETVHNRAQELIAEHPRLDYHEAMGAVLAADPP